MGRLRAALDAPADGAVQLLLLEGETGAGKTRLMQEVAIEARARQFVVLSGRAHASDQSRQYYPILEALSRLPVSLPVAGRGEANKGWKQILELTKGSDGEGAEAITDAREREVLDSISAIVLLAARTGGTVLLLEDIEWADPYSLRALRRLAGATRGHSVLLVGTFCDVDVVERHPEFAEALQRLSRERLAERVTVRRLSLDETTALVESIMNQGKVSEEFASFVYRRTKGIPRLIDELVRSLGGRLELQCEIGAGSTGRVFQAFDGETEQVVAAKLVLAREGIELDDLLRFQREGAVLSALHHPNIVRVYDTFAEEHAACIIMELLEGPSLAGVLATGPISLSRAKNIGMQVAGALAYAHSQSIVHRDVKPDNVMILSEDRVKVTDFGIARILRTDNSLGTIATTGMRAGTPSYMAPEQIGGKEIDGRADVYALGAMLFHMVAGRPPFEGPDKLAIAVKHLQDQPIAPSSINPAVPADWDALILKALAKDPAKRFQSAQLMERAIVGLSERRSPKLRTTNKRSKVAVAGGLLVAFMIVALLVWRWPVSTAHATVSTQIKTYLSGLAKRGQLSGTVLVAHNGKMLVDSGYGLADKSGRISNGPNTRYGVGGVSQAFSITAVLRFVEQGVLKWNSSICTYLPTCPRSWKPITVGMVVEGRADLPFVNFGVPGNSPSQSLIQCQKLPLDAKLGSKIDYQNCTDLVMGLLIEHAPGPAASSWGAANVFGLDSMINTGQLTDSMRSPQRALAYDGPKLDTNVAFNDYFAAYSTTTDVLAYDKALFGGQLLSPRDTARVFAPRPGQSNGVFDPSDYGVSHPAWGYDWKVGRLLGHAVAYTLSNVNDFQTVNLRFPGSRITVIVLGNDVQNNVWAIATNAGALVLGKRPLPIPGPPNPSSSALMGTYQRVFTKSDWRVSRDNGETPWVGLSFRLVVGRRDFYFVDTTDEYYRATADGRLSLLNFNPAVNTSSPCSLVVAETPPPSSYRWSLRGRDLVITAVSDNHCADRQGLVRGVWKRVP
jgi:serine/threonine protein kinase